MNKKNTCVLLTTFFVFSATATVPIEIDLAPGESAARTVAENACTIYEYRVKNNTNMNMPFSLSLANGISSLYQAGDNDKYNPNQFCQLGRLNSGASCMLKLRVCPSQIQSKTGYFYGGLNVLVDGSPLAAYQPVSSQQIDISVTSPVDGLVSSVPSMALSVKNESLNSALTGKPRTITLTNTNTKLTIVASYSIVYNSPYSESALPPGTTVVADDKCNKLAPGETCNITITPGASSTDNPQPQGSIGLNDPKPNPMLLYIQGVSTTGVTVSAPVIPVNIVTYGSVYQGGYVFSVDDTTSASQSILGKVAGYHNLAPFWPAGVVWVGNGDYSCEYTSDDTDHPYQYCTDLTTDWGSLSQCKEGSTSCPGTPATNGASNTKTITSFYTTSGGYGKDVDQEYYAAGKCVAFNTSEINKTGFSDWYLPAICEMGYFVPNFYEGYETLLNSGCGSKTTPLMQNMQSNLRNLGFGNLFGPLWSSTAYCTQFSADGSCASGASTSASWSQYFFTFVTESGLSFEGQTHDSRSSRDGVRCVRVLTQPTS